MTDELSTEARLALKSALRHLESEAPAAPPLPSGGLSTPRRMWSRPVMVTAAFALAAAVALPTLWWFQSNETKAPNPSSTAAVTTTSTTNPGTTAGTVSSTSLPEVPGAIDFYRVPDPFGVFESGTLVETAPSGDGGTLGGTSGISIVAVADSPEGLVAVGHEQVGLRSIAAAWISLDGGLTWERSQGSPAVFGGTDHPISDVIPSGLSMQAVSYGNGRFIALGTDTTTDMTPVAWLSDDGRSWTRVAAADGPQWGEAYTSISGLVFNNGGFVGIGIDSSGDPRATSVLVWTSPDGLTWDSDLDAMGATHLSIVTDLTVIGGSLVAVGYTHDSESVEARKSPAAWLSSDALTWIPAQVTSTIPLDALHTEMRSVTATPFGGIATGWTLTTEALNVGANPDVLVWTTVDGSVWLPVDVGDLDEESVRIPGPVTSGNAGIVAILSLRAEVLPEYDPAVQVWTSEDGVSWEQTSLGFLGEINDIFFTSAGYVAVGSAPRPTEEIDPMSVIWDGAVWIGTMR